MSDRTAPGLPGVADPEWAVWLVGNDPETGTAIRRRALNAGRSVFDVDVGAARSTDDLVADISRES